MGVKWAEKCAGYLPLSYHRCTCKIDAKRRKIYAEKNDFPLSTIKMFTFVLLELFVEFCAH